MAMTIRDHWMKTKDAAAMNLARVTDKHEPHTEDEVKDLVARAFRGTCKDAAEAIVEAMEWMIAYHMAKATEPIVQ